MMLPSRQKTKRSSSEDTSAKRDPREAESHYWRSIVTNIKTITGTSGDYQSTTVQSSDKEHRYLSGPCTQALTSFCNFVKKAHVTALVKKFARSGSTNIGVPTKKIEDHKEPAVTLITCFMLCINAFFQLRKAE